MSYDFKTGNGVLRIERHNEHSSTVTFMPTDEHPWKNDLRAYLRALENPRQEITHLYVAMGMREVRDAEKKYGDSARVAHLRQYIADNGGYCNECLEMYEKALNHINPILFQKN